MSRWIVSRYSHPLPEDTYTGVQHSVAEVELEVAITVLDPHPRGRPHFYLNNCRVASWWRVLVPVLRRVSAKVQPWYGVSPLAA